MLCTEEVAKAMEPGLHGTTFGGGPLACAVALAVISEMEKTQLLEHVTEVGTYFRSALKQLQREHDCIVDVRGEGLMLGIELDSAELATGVAKDLLGQHILINRTSEVVLRFLPPYGIETEHIDRAVQALEQAFAKLAAPVAAGGNHGK
jgi:acetylornithine aminotransferase/acetylornithine/N-succinyldiaminopimelate aminotransferase